MSWELLEAILWPDGPICPQCGAQDWHFINSAGVRDRLRDCRMCGAQFTVTVGTIMEGTHLSPDKWLGAIRLMLSARDISVKQMAKELGLNYRIAWTLTERLRFSRRRKVHKARTTEEKKCLRKATRTLREARKILRQPVQRSQPKASVQATTSPTL